MKIIQLNAWGFRHFNGILEFLKNEKPDIINLQEVEFGHPERDPLGSNNYFEILKNKLNMDGVFVPWKKVKLNNGNYYEFGNAFLTNLDIIDYGSFFEPTLDQFKIVTEDNDAFQAMVKNDKTKYYAFFNDAKNFLWATLKYKNQVVRNLTTHFTVSYKCTETLQIINQGRSIANFLENVKPLPTIFSGDLNIHDKSHTVELLKEKLNLVNPGLENTLSPKHHPIFHQDHLSKGLAVDYIFQNGLQVSNWRCPEVGISDHLPIIANLDLI